jgi:hypothetical protein
VTLTQSRLCPVKRLNSANGDVVRSSYARMNSTDLENLKKPLQLPGDYGIMGMPDASDMPDELR